MNGNPVMKNGEVCEQKIFPIFYKKKALPVDKIGDLEAKMQEVVNKKLISDGEIMLDKIRDKDDAFVARLEAYLEQFKNENAGNVLLIEDMVPGWSPQKDPLDYDADIPPVDEAIERLKEWYAAMEAYVNMQRDTMNQIIGDWFTLFDTIASEGEPDAQIRHVQYSTDSDSEDFLTDMKNPANIFWYYLLILIGAIQLVMFYEPGDVKTCTDKPFTCITRNILEFFVFIHDNYLAFHNITLEYPCTAEINSSVYYK